jgi:hypothetical protein
VVCLDLVKNSGGRKRNRNGNGKSSSNVATILRRDRRRKTQKRIFLLWGSSRVSTYIDRGIDILKHSLVVKS